MSRHTLFNGLRLLAILLFACLLPGPQPAGGSSAPEPQEDVAPARPAAPSACPAAPAVLPDVIERTNFCVYYNDDPATATTPTTLAQATVVADHVEDYWDRYDIDFGFLAPSAVGKLEVQIRDRDYSPDDYCDGGCNGATNSGGNWMYVCNGCFDEDECIQKVAGHELFHRVEYSYHGDEFRWLKDGTDRAIEDNAYNNIDNWPAAVTQNTCSSFNKQVNSYLLSTSEDITTDDMKYNSCLWWKYFEEQFGSSPGEPELGVDAFVELWEAAVAADDVAAVNAALAALGAGTDFNTAFRRFTVANWTKGLTGVPDASYSYVDEQQAGNPDDYGPIIPEPEAGDDGIITTGDPAAWINQAIDNAYGARYYAASLGAACPVASATFHKDFGDDAFYHVVTQNAGAFSSHREGSADDWTQSFLNDGITRIAAVIGTQADDARVDVTLSCANPVVEIKLPNDVAVAYVGPSDAHGKFLAQVLVTNGAPTGPVVAGLTNNDFKASVNGIDATVTGGGFIQEQYWLEIEAPVQAANGTYDLEIVLEAPGSDTEIASDTNADSVTYTPDNIDHVLVVDRSGSMGEDSKLLSAQDAANFYIDITRNLDGLAVVGFNHNVNPIPFPMQAVDAGVRGDAKDFVRDLFASGSTSIGDGMLEAADQRVGSPTGNPLCSFVLLSDGMENTPEYWADVDEDVIDTHCPTTAIAFGPESNETLMQDIATATGGLSFYNDVFVSAPPGPASAEGASTLAPSAASIDDMALELSGSYEYAQERAERRQRLFLERGLLPYPVVEQTHHVLVDNTVSEALFALDWNRRGAEMELRLRDPSGKIYAPGTHPYTFADFLSGHLGWRISRPMPGEWLMLVTQHGGAQGPLPYQVLSSAHTRLTLELLLPDRTGRRFYTGNRAPIIAFVSAQTPIHEALVEADVTAPDGSLTTLRLFDDGQHGDGAAGDGFYGNFYTRVNQAIVAQPTGEDITEPPALDEGAYRVRARARHAAFQREAWGSFAVLEGADLNQNRLPDPFEKERGVSSPTADPDLDGLDNLGEYRAGTDPNNSDTDRGGENDGSEVLLHKLDPLDPDDDQIEAPEFFHGKPDNGGALLTYDVKREYDQILLYRATNRLGPWTLRNADLPLSGAYRDPAVNGTSYFYRLLAADSLNHRSAVLSSEAVKPAADPLPPQGRVIIDGGARITRDLNVLLSFAAYENEAGDPDPFADIASVLISNDPFFAGAQWQPFSQGVPWQLPPLNPGSLARVYVRFRDAAGNLSVGTELGTILYEQELKLYLPMVLR